MLRIADLGRRDYAMTAQEVREETRSNQGKFANNKLDVVEVTNGMKEFETMQMQLIRRENLKS